MEGRGKRRETGEKNKETEGHEEGKEGNEAKKTQT